MNSLFLVTKLTQENFLYEQKVMVEMKQLFVDGSWKLYYVQSPIACSNRISIVTLNTRSLQPHLDEILQDEDFMSYTILCFQET
jgi:hypothetical protein